MLIGTTQRLVLLLLFTAANAAASDWRLRLDWPSYDQAPGRDAVVQPELAQTTDQQPDLAGLRRDTGYFVGYQVVTIGILYLMPEGVSGWSEESKEEYSFEQWRDNVANPHWDKDDDFINYALHPYWGAAYYVRARDRGLQRPQSLLYSAALSTLYEFGVEALFEQPSIQDLIVTPLGAVLLGERFYRYHRKLRNRLATERLSTRQRWALVLTDPLGALNERVDRLFGRDAQISLRAFTDRRPGLNLTRPGAAGGYPGRQRTYGVELKLRF